jgi:hypothetical protein
MDSVIDEFPFAAALPKREKGKLAKLLDLVAGMNALVETEGALLPVMLTAKVLGVSRQRVDELCETGKLRRFDVDGHPFVTENSCVEFCKTERKAGRPVKLPTTWAESRKRARSTVEK